MKTLMLTAAAVAALAGAPAAFAAAHFGTAPRPHVRQVAVFRGNQVFFVPTTELGGFRVIRAPTPGVMVRVRFDHERRFDHRFDHRFDDGWDNGGSVAPGGDYPQSAAAAAVEPDDIDPMSW
jgi:hypothetical protein